jgi:hypothetical protein
MFYLYCSGDFWTGCNWTNERRFAKKYSYMSAFDIRHKRFMQHKPRVLIRACREFWKKKKGKSESRLQL